jgi:transposase
VSDHLIAEANRHAKALHQMTLPTTKPNQRDIDWYIAECIDLRRQLEYEIEAKRNHLRIAIEEISGLKIKTGFYEMEIARLRADKERLTELLRRWKEFIDEAVVAEDYSNLDGDNAETVLSQINDGAEEMLALLTPEELAAIDAARKEQP